MANAATQARWRARTSRKRIEVYLPEDIASQLDALSRARNQSRAQYISSLIAAAAAAANAKPPASPEKPPPQKPERLATGSYRFRRPRGGEAAEQRHDWIAEYQGGLRVGLRRRPAHEYYRWRGLVIDHAGLMPKDAKGHTRQEVMRAIVDRYLF